MKWIGKYHYRVVAPYMVAAISTHERDGLICETAPILHWAKGMFINEFIRRVKRQGWLVELLK